MYRFQIGIVSSVGAETFEGTFFEACEERAVPFQGSPDQSEDVRQPVRRQMEEGAAGPDPVEFISVTDVFEQRSAYDETGVPFGNGAHPRRTVDSGNFETRSHECKGIPSGTASEVQYAASRRQDAGEPFPEGSKVRHEGFCGVLFRIVVVEIEGSHLFTF